MNKAMTDRERFDKWWQSEPRSDENGLRNQIAFNAWQAATRATAQRCIAACQTIKGSGDGYDCIDAILSEFDLPEHEA